MFQRGDTIKFIDLPSFGLGFRRFRRSTIGVYGYEASRRSKDVDDLAEGWLVLHSFSGLTCHNLQL